jgi:hypothetical protein
MIFYKIKFLELKKNYGFKGFLGAIPFIFCGNELKKNIDKFKNKKYLVFQFFF